MKDNELLERFFNHRPRPLAESTKRKYKTDLQTYKDYTGLTLEQLIKEAKEEQRTRIVDNILIECDINETKLAERLDGFHQYEKNRGIQTSTLHTRINNIRTFLTAMGVKQLPPRINDKTDTKFILLPKEKIQKAIRLSNTTTRSIILCLATSGMRISDLTNMTIEDYLTAMDCERLDELQSFFNKPCNIIPYFSFNPQKTPRNICQTCITPEANESLLEYLHGRWIINGLEKDEPLFMTHKMKKMKPYYFANICNRLNHRLAEEEKQELEHQLQQEMITPKEYDEKMDNISKFHAHALRKWFISTASSHTSNLRVLLLMEGHRSIVPTDKNYVSISKETIRREYMKLIPFLSFQNTKVRVLTDEKIVQYEKRIKEQDERLGRLEEFISDLKNFPY